MEVPDGLLILWRLDITRIGYSGLGGMGSVQVASLELSRHPNVLSVVVLLGSPDQEHERDFGYWGSMERKTGLR